MPGGANTCESLIDQLAALCGIIDHYKDTRGERQQIPQATKAKLLACNCDCNVNF